MKEATATVVLTIRFQYPDHQDAYDGAHKAIEDEEYEVKTTEVMDVYNVKKMPPDDMSVAKEEG